MLSINTNLSSLIAQNSMKTSSFKLDTAIERMTTGYKINHAKDNAANYSIATNMTTKIGAYMVAEDNVLQGLDMVATASQNLNLIEDKLSRLRALAVQSSSGSYGEQSLKAINAEANALVDEINRTYSTSEYNGQKVFKNITPMRIPDGIGATGNGAVQPIATYSLRTTPSPRATDYGGFLVDPVQRNVDHLDSVSSIDPADGFTESEYKIAEVADLVALAELVNDDGLDTTGVTFVLAKDLDIGAYCDTEIANGNGGWTPIGNWDNHFKGTFDGNGHLIKNLQIDRVAGAQGLFGYVQTGSEFKNVGLEGGSVKGKGGIGGLAGHLNWGCSINNCYAAIDVTGSENNVGGLVGSTADGTSINNCYATGNVAGSQGYVGGLVGDIYGTDVNNCYATGTVSGKTYVGGLVGNLGHSSINNCYATGDVTGSQNCVGGLAGSVAYFSTISSSHAAGNVTGSQDYVGGLLGQGSVDISNSYATGNIIGDSFVGGLIGLLEGKNGTANITNSLSYSTVSGSDINSTGSLIGGTVVTTDNSTFGTINVTGCKTASSDNNIIGGSYMYASSTYTLLPDYDMSTMTAGVSLYKPEVTSLTLQVGANAPDSNQITFDMAFMLDNVDDLRQIGLNTTADSLALCDSLIAMVNEKQTLYGAVENRLMSVLDEISTQYENLVSSRSTIRDADMSEVSSEYIRQQILQQASATLMSTANQSPAIALQLI